jgi:hypothetical protein
MSTKFKLFNSAALSTALTAMGIRPAAETAATVPPVEDGAEDGDEGEEGQDGAPPPAPAPAPEPAPAPAPSASTGELEVIAMSEVTGLLAEAQASGRQMERERCHAVMSSDQGKKAPAMAAWVLRANPEAKAEDLIKMLGDAPGLEAAGGIPDTKLKLGKNPGEPSADSGADAWNGYWASVGRAPVAQVAPQAVTNSLTPPVFTKTGN